MFFPEGQVRVLLLGEPVDMRKRFTGLYAPSKHRLKQDPLSGHLYVFINRRDNYLKALYGDRTGFGLWAKRLERGRFVSHWHRPPTQELDWTGLKRLLAGIEPGHQRLRYEG